MTFLLLFPEAPERIKSMLKSKEIGMIILGVIALREEYGAQVVLDRCSKHSVVAYDDVNVMSAADMSKTPGVKLSDATSIVLGAGGAFISDYVDHLDC